MDLYSKLSKSKLKLISIKRLYKSIEERKLEYKIIDLTVSIESIFGAKTEISYRIALRISYLLGNNYAEIKLIFDFIKRVYQIRNDIVHGSDEYLNEIRFKGKILKIKDFYLHYERISRICIQKYLNLSTYYSSKQDILDQVDESIKRGSPTKELKQKSEGIFSNPKDYFPYIGF